MKFSWLDNYGHLIKITFYGNDPSFNKRYIINPKYMDTHHRSWLDTTIYNCLDNAIFIDLEINSLFYDATIPLPLTNMDDKEAYIKHHVEKIYKLKVFL